MKILLFGKNGQVGRELRQTLPPLGELVAMGRQEADLTDLSAPRRILLEQAPEIIVNAAAYTAVDQAESEPAAACLINAEAVAVMAGYAAGRKVLLVHYSTDYVFDGRKSAPYLEDDPTNPLSVYGRSKLAGEEAIRQRGCQALVFRTSWVFSPHGKNFVKTVLRLAGEREALKIVADQHGAPTSAELIAELTAKAIAAYRAGKLNPGLYHLAPAGESTWHGLAVRIVEQALAGGAVLKLNPAAIEAISTSEYPLPARRPLNSRLDTTRLAKGLGITMPDWRLHLDRTVAGLINAKENQ